MNNWIHDCAVLFFWDVQGWEWDEGTWHVSNIMSKMRWRRRQSGQLGRDVPAIAAWAVLLCSDKTLSRWKREARNYRPRRSMSESSMAQDVVAAWVCLSQPTHTSRHTHTGLLWWQFLCRRSSWSWHCNVCSDSWGVMWAHSSRLMDSVVCHYSGLWWWLCNSQETDFCVGAALISLMQRCTQESILCFVYTLTHTHMHTPTQSSPSFFIVSPFSHQLLTLLAI